MLVLLVLPPFIEQQRVEYVQGDAEYAKDTGDHYPSYNA